jgi:hypothetical protein
MKFIGKTLGPIKDIVVSSKELAQKINNSAFTLHIKLGGESYGHVFHNSFAIGRPVIINRNDFKNSSIDEILEDALCFDVSRYSPQEIQRRLILASQPEEWNKLKEKVKSRFFNIVNFDEDSQKVKKFMENL